MVSVSDCVLLLPTCTFPKLRLDALSLSDPGVTPVPESGKLRLGLEASLVIATLPVTVPPDVGAKLMPKLVL